MANNIILGDSSLSNVSHTDFSCRHSAIFLQKHRKMSLSVNHTWNELCITMQSK